MAGCGSSRTGCAGDSGSGTDQDVPLQASPIGAAYDDVWAGGWEELFPNDAPGAFEGRDLPDHGEWWTMAWTALEATGGSEATGETGSHIINRAR